MRRLFRRLVFAALAVCLTPVSAQAYFWDWIDSLSGPEFHGTLIEWKVWCKTSRPTEAVAKLRAKAEAVVRTYETAENNARDAFERKNLREARRAATLSLTYIDAATLALEGRSSANPRAMLVSGLRWRGYALARFAYANTPAALRSDVEPDAPVEVAVATEEVGVQAFAGGGPGLAVSLCDAGPYERHTRFLSVNVSWGSDNLERNDGDRNTLVTLGASYHAVLTPWLSAGVGGGVASFSSVTAPAFRKWYIEPYIVDLRPARGIVDLAAWLKRPAGTKVQDDKVPSTNPWPDVLFLRYSTILFPTGIEAQRFGGRSPQYPAELIHSYGVHADLEPLVRKMRGRY